MLDWNLRGNTVDIVTYYLVYGDNWCWFCFGVLCRFNSSGKRHGEFTDCRVSAFVEEWSIRQLSKIEYANAEALDQQLGFWRDRVETAQFL